MSESTYYITVESLILSYLHSNQSMPYTEQIIRDLQLPRMTVIRKLSKLEEDKLVTVEYRERKKYYQLAPIGEIIAKKLPDPHELVALFKLDELVALFIEFLHSKKTEKTSRVEGNDFIRIQQSQLKSDMKIVLQKLLAENPAELEEALSACIIRRLKDKISKDDAKKMLNNFISVLAGKQKTGGVYV